MSVILNEDLTTVDLDGTGAFDLLMRSAEARLKEEHSSGRITGTEYGKVYLGSMQSSMGQAIQFLLGRQAADKQAELLAQQTSNAVLENDLLACQILKCEAETANIVQRTANEVISGDNLVRTGLGITQQTAKALADTALSTASKFKVDQETLLVAQEVLNKQQQVLLTAAQVAKTTQDTQVSIAQEANVIQDTAVKVASEANINQSILESKQKVLNLVEEALKTIQDTAKAAQDVINAVSTNTVITNTGLKVAQEVSLLTQKVLTEEAQIVDQVSGATTPVSGVIGTQKVLYTRQSEGFLRDAEQKLAKIQLDALSVRVSADPNTGTTPTSLSNSNIDLVLDKAKTGIGA